MPAALSSNQRIQIIFFIAVALIGTAVVVVSVLPDPGGASDNGGEAVVAVWVFSNFQLDLVPRPGGWGVEGTAGLAEGERVPLEIVYFDPAADPFETKTATVEGGRISAEFGPYDAPLPSGPYLLRIRPEGGSPFQAAKASIGDAEEVAREEEYRKVHFVRVLTGVREAISDLSSAADEGREGGRFADSKGSFRSEDWREWLDEVFLSDLGRIEASHMAYRDAFAADRYPTASARIRDLLDAVRGLGGSVTGDVHRIHGLPPPPGTSSEADREEIDRWRGEVAAQVGIEDRGPPPEDRTESVRADGIVVTRKIRGETSILQIDGSVDLPDQCEYAVDLRFHREQNSIVASRRPVGRHFRLRMDEPGRSVPSGKYFLRITFDYMAQHPAVRERIDSEAPGLREGMRKTITFHLGTEEDVAREDEERLAHYRDLLRSAAAWFWDIQKRVEDGGIGEAFTGDDGALDIEIIREWSGKEDAALRELRESHEAFRAGTAAPKYESEARSAAQLLRALGEEKDKAIADLLGRASLIVEPFEIPIDLGKLNSLVRDEICPGVGLDPVTLGSLRIIEAQDAERDGDRRRALELFLRLDRPRVVQEKIVEARALKEASRILLEDGRDWRAVPVLERLAESRRYRGLAAAKEGEEVLIETLGAASWEEEKQEAYLRDLTESLDRIRDRIDTGRLEAAAFRLKGWAALEKGYREVFESKVTDAAIREEIEDLISVAKTEATRRKTCELYLREAFKRFEILKQEIAQWRTGRTMEAIEQVNSILGQMEAAGLPDPIVRRVNRRVEAAGNVLDHWRESVAELERKGVKAVAVTSDGKVLFRLPDAEKPVPLGLGEEVIDGIYIIDIRQTEDGKFVILKKGDLTPFPFPIEK